jgi:heme exporter protein D
MGFGSMDGNGIIPDWGEMANGGLMMLIWIVLIIVLITVAVAWISRVFQRKSGKESVDDLEKSPARDKNNTQELE